MISKIICINPPTFAAAKNTNIWFFHFQKILTSFSSNKFSSMLFINQICIILFCKMSKIALPARPPEVQLCILYQHKIIMTC